MKIKENINFKEIYFNCLSNIKTIMNKNFFDESFVNSVEKVLKN